MKGFFIYMFLDQEETPLYIGQSINLINRIEKQHFLSEYGNLSEDCIHKTKQVLYHECISADDMKIKERYLINTLSPEFNIALNNKSKFSFSIHIDWKYLPLNTEGILEKKEENRIIKKDGGKTINIIGSDLNVYEDKLVTIIDKRTEYREYFIEAFGEEVFNRDIENDPFLFNHKYRILYINYKLYIYGNNTLANDYKIDRVYKKKVNFIKGKHIIKTDTTACFIQYDIMKKNKFLSEELIRIIDKENSKFIKKENLKYIKNITSKVELKGAKTAEHFFTKISEEYKNDYVKGYDLEGDIYLIFKINGEIYIHLKSFFYGFIYHKKPTKGKRIFNDENINDLGLSKGDYLSVEIVKFKDEDFIANFYYDGQKEDAKHFGYPIIVQNKGVFFAGDEGLYYEYEFELLKFESLKKLNLLLPEYLNKIENDLLKIFFND